MKKTNIGLILLLSSAIIYGSTLISASVYSKVLLNGSVGWDSRYGIFGTAIREVGSLSLIISVLLGIAGIVLIVMSLRNK
ncbi:hypothetical protein GCM10008983_03680 [Lentibacillus halophilus]|uniref:Phosphatase n=1 Tax=Lentibacillus halophilus TaxID=295065 RepID=A0ABP3IWU5_9BACI